MGTRHLARLFQKHIGASSLQTAKTFPVQRAKRLLNETDFPMTEFAFRAGFKSVRRFNSVFRELYGRAPPEMLRGQGRRHAASFAQDELYRRLA